MATRPETRTRDKEPRAKVLSPVGRRKEARVERKYQKRKNETIDVSGNYEYSKYPPSFFEARVAEAIVGDINI